MAVRKTSKTPAATVPSVSAPRACGVPGCEVAHLYADGLCLEHWSERRDAERAKVDAKITAALRNKRRSGRAV